MPVNLRVPGLNQSLSMFVHGPHDKQVSHKIREEGVWEPYETSLILSRLQAGDVFIDVGANIGFFTLIAASLVGEHGQVFAFEPDPVNHALLMKNVHYNKLAPRIHSVMAGLSTVDAKGTLFLSKDNLGDHRIYPGRGCRETCDIDLLNGAEYLRDQLRVHSHTGIDLIKVDTQGSETQVMEGLMPLLLELLFVPPILIELTPFSLREAGSSGRQLIELLASLHLDFYIVDHIAHQLVASSAPELARWCDNVDACQGDEGFMNIFLCPRK